MSCNTGGLNKLLEVLKGSGGNARSQAEAMAAAVRESRSVAVADNAERPGLATATGSDFGDGSVAGSDPSSPGVTGGVPSMDM